MHSCKAYSQTFSNSQPRKHEVLLGKARSQMFDDIQLEQGMVQVLHSYTCAMLAARCTLIAVQLLLISPINISHVSVGLKLVYFCVIFAWYCKTHPIAAAPAASCLGVTCTCADPAHAAAVRASPQARSPHPHCARLLYLELGCSQSSRRLLLHLLLAANCCNAALRCNRLLVAPTPLTQHTTNSSQPLQSS
jgi:hypothetical protein